MYLLAAATRCRCCWRDSLARTTTVAMTIASRQKNAAVERSTPELTRATRREVRIANDAAVKPPYEAAIATAARNSQSDEGADGEPTTTCSSTAVPTTPKANARE